MNRIILTLWTIYGLSFSQVTGPDGQDCTPPVDDNAPDACNQTAPFGTLSDTIIECEENFDCCTCDSITCGTPTPGPFCDKFVANGDSSAFGVQPIIINGNPNDGATVECTGNRACERSVIQGTGVKDFKCGAVRACNQANVSITCVTDGCKVECDGPQACSGQNATVRGSFTIANSNGLKCGLEACANSIFALDSDVGGKVECDGQNACENIEITVSNIESFGCSGTNACQNGVITVTNPQDDFAMECEGDFGCQGADITIIIPADSTVTDLNGIDCSGSCKDANITIINNSPNVVEIEELNCEGEPGSCDGLRVTLENNGTGDIVFDECKCGGGGCVSASGIDFCFVGLDKVECEGTACFGQTITITDPKKDFELLCKEVASCNDLEITIIITDNAEDNPIDKIKGVKCEKDMSCVGILFDVINQQTNVGLVTIEEVKCEGDDGTSCTGGAVFTGVNVTYDKIECDGNCGTLITDCRILAEGGDVFCEDF